MSETIPQVALWLLVIGPAVVGGLLALMRRAETRAGVIAVVTAAVTVAASLLVAFTGPSVSVPFVAGSSFALGVDPLSAVVTPLVSVSTLLVLVTSSAEIRESAARFHGLMLLFAAAALATATATTLPTLLFAWEVMGATSFALIGFWWREDHRVSAGVVAFVTTRAADVGMYVAAGAALAAGAGLALADLPEGSAGWRGVVAAGLVVSALGKAAQLPFSFWLSRAMAGPSPVSALLHSAAMVAMGGYLLLRVSPLLEATGWAAEVTAWAGGLTALVLGAVAVGQRDLKQLLAASTSAQIGFVVMAAGLGAVGPGLAQLVAHAATKALLFLAAGAWLTALGTKQLPGLVGVARRWPVVGVTSVLALLSLGGIAPFALWATKESVLVAAREGSSPLYAVGLVAAALSAAYAGKVLVLVVRRVPPPERARIEAHWDSEQPGTRHLGVQEQAPLTVLAVGAVLLGALALPPLGGVLAEALGEEKLPAAPLELLVSAGLALAVTAVVWRRPAPEPRWALAWLGLERAAMTLVVRPTLRIARACARFDDRVLDRAVSRTATSAIAVSQAAVTADRQLDRAVDRTATSSVAASKAAATADLAAIDGTVERIATWLRGLGRLARRPQTGQLHEYYVQVVAVLAAGALLLLTVR